jgi:hypothetical protein
MSKSSRKSIVVVGGGAAGATITRILSAKIDANTTSLTLVTARPFALHLPAAIRMTTSAEDKLEESVLIPYDSLLVKGNGTVKVGRVTGIEQGKEGKDGSVVLSTGERIHYDFLVLAPGAEWDGPLALPDDRAAVLEHIRSWRRKFENAKTGIVLAGGGAVGLGRLFLPEPSYLDVYVFFAQNMRVRSRTRSPTRKLPSSTRTLNFSTLRTLASTASGSRRISPPAVSTSSSMTMSTTLTLFP